MAGVDQLAAVLSSLAVGKPPCRPAPPAQPVTSLIHGRGDPDTVKLVGGRDPRQAGTHDHHTRIGRRLSAGQSRSAPGACQHHRRSQAATGNQQLTPRKRRPTPQLNLGGTG